MGRRGRDVAGPDGLLLVDKPAGVSSAAVVARVRRVFGGVRAGHTGTLDPFATGLLPICLGEGTKLATYLTDTDKSYEGVILLGVRTDTYDCTGTIEETADVPPLARETLAAIAAGMTGETLQTPPAYSAIKRQGRPMYELARRGEAPELEPRPVRVDRCELEPIDGTHVRVAVDCSKGFYVRSLARDVGEQIGCGAVLESLRRTRVGPLAIDDAVALADLEGPEGRMLGLGRMRGMNEALAHLRPVTISQDEAREVRLGRQGPLLRIAPGRTGEKIRLSWGNELVAVAAGEGRLWVLERVFAPAATPGVTPCPHGGTVLPPSVS
jgi:tRNA pseudouridine55 synthase